jgi:hypothetical protein
MLRGRAGTGACETVSNGIWSSGVLDARDAIPHRWKRYSDLSLGEGLD